MATGMNISGDARMWWHNAAGAYARGQVPERGSVLAFMSSGGMARGHVAVVSRVVNPRTVQIDHANWAGPGIRRGSVMRGVTVVDVSDRNDWTSVRVQVGHGVENFGRTYPTHGFIYNRAAGSGLMMAGGAPMNEVAEAPSPHAALHLRFALETLAQ
jgi:surface antigen